MIFKFTVAAFMAMTVQSCSDVPMKASDPGAKKTVKNTQLPSQTAKRITGTLSNEGVMCSAMRGDDGELYTFELLPEGLSTGDRIEVVKSEKNTSPVSFCDQGQVLRWSKITRMTADNKTDRTWLAE